MSTYTRMIESLKDDIKELFIELEALDKDDHKGRLKKLDAIEYARGKIAECRYGEDNG